MNITIGALAHVDAGKTSLAESILYLTSSIQNKGRVDHEDAFLDYNPLEKQKGITIYNKEARFKYRDNNYIYVDTPGHNDLAYEANRAIKVLDCAILIISAIEDIPSDTIKQFKNLKNYNIPILIFVNKMDISHLDKATILNNLKNKLDINCIDYIDTFEHLSLLSDELLDEYLNTNTISKDIVINCLHNQEYYPCFFGSALKDDGVKELLDYIDKYVITDYNVDLDLNALIYKVSNEYSYIKVLQGILNNKTSFNEYKINEMYEVSGDNYSPIQSASAGEIVAVKGLKDIKLGTYLPSMFIDDEQHIPSLTYKIVSNLDANDLYKQINVLNNEEPNLNIKLENKNVYINLNGELHQTIIINTIKEKFNIDVSFSTPIIRYKETIKEETIGVGHFEPLRHYGEAIVKIEPIENGIEVKSNLNNNYINTLLSYLKTYSQRGILTNNPLINVRYTILDIKTHPKHTEGQDLIESVKRAIRQGLTKVESKLLEPYYITTINTNNDNLNIIISELTQNKYTYSIEENNIVVSIPIIRFNDVITTLKSKLKGNLSFSIEETIYDECLNSPEVIEARHYDYESDHHNPAGSIFCKQGAGHYVEPSEVESLMHLSMDDYIEKVSTIVKHNKSKINEDELKRVWNSIYKPKPRYIEKKKDIKEEKPYVIKPSKPLLYLIDGYNLMYKLDEELAINDLMNARNNVTNMVCDFAGYVSSEVVLVFDAYNNNYNKPAISKYDNITIVYTKQNQTADTYIENKSREMQKEYKVIVVTSDNLEQLRVFSNDASIISSNEFINRYNNLRKNNQKVSTYKSFKPFEDLKCLLEEDD